MRIVAVIPAFNESMTIERVVSHVKDHAHDVLVVDDGSHDQTALFARRAGANVVSNPSNYGIGKALMTGYYYARKNRC